MHIFPAQRCPAPTTKERNSAEQFAAIRSHTATAVRHGQNMLDVLVQAADANPWIPVRLAACSCSSISMTVCLNALSLPAAAATASSIRCRVRSLTSPSMVGV